MLAEAQKQLAEHFLGLRTLREKAGGAVFAIEHPLAPAQLAFLRDALRAALERDQRLSDQAWLVWVVLATEAGYDYSGEEYWQSFGDQFLIWDRLGNRNQLREWFQRFARAYHGFQPVGPWAEHRTIICWPISHAILPRDLHAPFMRAFHLLRHELAARSDASADELGTRFAEHAPTTSHRLTSFLEQHAIVGQLVLGLVSDAPAEEDNWIARHARARIVADLERDAMLSACLSDTRRVFRDARLRVSRNLARSAQVRRDDPSRPGSANRRSMRLVAVRDGAAAWSLRIALPSLAARAVKDASVKQAMGRAIVAFLDSPTRQRPGNVLLQPRIERPLAELPLPGTALVRFDERLGARFPWMDAEYRFPEGVRWLLHLDADDRAQEVLGAHVRPGHSYLLVTRTVLSVPRALQPWCAQHKSATQNAHITEIIVPNMVGSEHVTALDALGLGFRLQVTVAAAGLVPRPVLSTGATEWREGEEIILALSADHAVRSYRLRINGVAHPLPVRDAASVLVSLGVLEAGDYAVDVDGIIGTPRDERVLTGHMQIRVCSRTAELMSATHQAGIVAELVPSNARLEDVLSGHAQIDVFGPRGREIDARCELLLARNRPLETVALGRLRLPITGDQVTRALRLHEVELLASREAHIVFDSGELGRAGIHIAHGAAAPLRWIVKRGAHETSVCLIDETDEPDVKIVAANAGQPDRFQAMKIDLRTSDLVVVPPGVLLCASLKGRQYPVFVSMPPSQQMQSLQDLGMTISLNPRKTGAAHFINYLNLLRLWSRTRVYGGLGIVRRDQIVRAIRERLMGIACGVPWAAALESAVYAQDGPGDLHKFIGGGGFGSRVGREAWTGLTALSADTDRMLAAAALYKVCAERRIVAAAMMFAFDPLSLRFGRDDPMAAELLKHRIVLRAATYAALKAQGERAPQRVAA